MKILVINKYFFLNGGSERVFFQEREFMLRKGLQVIDFSMDHEMNRSSEYTDYFIPNIDFADGPIGNQGNIFRKISAGLKFVSNSQARARLKALIKKERPDIAHMHNIYHQLTPSIIPVLKDSGIKTVLTLHDYKLICPVYMMLRNGKICNHCQGRYFWRVARHSCCEGSFSKSILMAIEAYWHKWRKSYDFVDIFVSPSRFLSELLKDSRTEKNKVQVIPNGIELEDLKPNYKDWGYILYFGRITPQKGVETLLRAYEVMSNERGFKIKIVGDGPLLADLSKAYTNSMIEFTGRKTSDELLKLVSQSAFVVVPSQWYENCSMSVLEAMAMGKPVIASNIGGLPEQVEDGKTGFLFEMGNVEELAEKMNILVHDKELRLKMGRAARKKVEKEYSFDVHGQKLLKLYEKLLSGEYA